MKHNKILKVPATEKEVIDKITCDLCGKEIERNFGYDVNDVQVSHRTGSNYPEGGSGEETSADICGKCLMKSLSLG
jgi:hypothetical protein